MTGMAYFLKRTVCYEKADLYHLLLLNSGFFFLMLRGHERVWLSDDQMRELYQQKEAGYWHGVRENFKDEGVNCGFAQGAKKGSDAGKAKERKNLLAAARTMLNDGMDRLKVQRFTGLTDEEMESLCGAN